MRGRLALIAIAAAAAIVPIPAVFVERYYSTTIFPLVQRSVTAVSNLLSLALLDAFIVLVATWIVGQVALAFVSAGRIGWRWAAVRWLTSLVTTLAVLYLVFLVMWGLNYRRIPLVEKVRFDPNQVTAEAAHALALTAVEQVNALYAPAHAAAPLVSFVDPSLAAGLADAQRALGATRFARPGRPKHSILDVYFKSAGVEGMTDPFFLETLVAGDLFPFERPQVIAHEWAHLAGFADEGEANFVGWLACMRASHAAKYSGWLFLFGEVTAALRSGERADIASRLADGPRADLQAVADRVRLHVRPRVANAGWRVYDRYLRANRVESGVRSYAEVVRLVLGVRLE
jgi:hypothetical protein